MSTARENQGLDDRVPVRTLIAEKSTNSDRGWRSRAGRLKPFFGKTSAEVLDGTGLAGIGLSVVNAACSSNRPLEAVTRGAKPGVSFFWDFGRNQGLVAADKQGEGRDRRHTPD